MTGDEITTGSISTTSAEKRYLASRTRWWNSSGGGSHAKNTGLKGNIKVGDGGAKFRSEWADLDLENWEWMKTNKVDTATGNRWDSENGSSCGPQLGIAGGSSGHQAQAVVDAVVQQRDAGRGWIYRNKLLVLGGAIFLYVLIARLVRGGGIA